MNKWIIENEIGCMPDLFCVCQYGQRHFKKQLTKRFIQDKLNIVYIE